MDSKIRELLQGLDSKTIKMLNSVAEKLKSFSSLSDVDKKYCKNIYWESHDLKRSFKKLKEYFDYLLITFDDQEKLYKQENEEIRSKYKNNESQPVTLEWIEVSNGLNRFGIDYIQILFSSLLINIVSFIEQMIVSFSTKYFSDYVKPEKGIIQKTLCFLNKKGVTHSHRIFKNVVTIRNDFVHNNGIIKNSKDINLREYNLKKDKVTSKIILSKDFIHNLIAESERLFNGIYIKLYEIKEDM